MNYCYSSSFYTGFIDINSRFMNHKHCAKKDNPPTTDSAVGGLPYINMYIIHANVGYTIKPTSSRFFLFLPMTYLSSLEPFSKQIMPKESPLYHKNRK